MHPDTSEENKYWDTLRSSSLSLYRQTHCDIPQQAAFVFQILLCDWICAHINSEHGLVFIWSHLRGRSEAKGSYKKYIPVLQDFSTKCFILETTIYFVDYNYKTLTVSEQGQKIRDWPPAVDSLKPWLATLRVGKKSQCYSWKLTIYLAAGETWDRRSERSRNM